MRVLRTGSRCQPRRVVCLSLTQVMIMLTRVLPPTLVVTPKRFFFWEWLNMVANRCDPDRIKQVGPDKAAAEWIVRCGGAVKWRSPRSTNTQFDNNYDHIAFIQAGSVLEEVDATNSTIAALGFVHFKDLKHLKRLIIANNPYLRDDAFQQLHYLKDCLQHLELKGCVNISDNGVKAAVEQLPKLKTLTLETLMNVKDHEGISAFVSHTRPSCQVIYKGTS